MTIRDRILARPDLDALRAARDLGALAAALNAEALTAPQERYVTARTVLAECQDGPAILDALEAAQTTVSAVKWAVTFLSQNSGLDIGNPVTLGMVDQLVTNSLLSAAQGQQLHALAMQPVLVTAAQVADAMYNLDGTEK